MGIRTLVVIAAIVLVIFMVKRLLGSRKNDNGDVAKQRPSTAMVQCHHCGTFVPENEAVLRHQFIYCCDDHANQ